MPGGRPRPHGCTGWRSSIPPGSPSSAAAAGRLSFVGEGGDASALVLGAAAAEAVRRFDAIVLAATRWEPALAPLPRPGGHPVRRRVRVVTVVGDAGAASARRFDHAPDTVEVWPGPRGRRDRRGAAGRGVVGARRVTDVDGGGS